MRRTIGWETIPQKPSSYLEGNLPVVCAFLLLGLTPLGVHAENKPYVDKWGTEYLVSPRPSPSPRPIAKVPPPRPAPTLTPRPAQKALPPKAPPLPRLVPPKSAAPATPAPARQKKGVPRFKPARVSPIPAPEAPAAQPTATPIARLVVPKVRQTRPKPTPLAKPEPSAESQSPIVATAGAAHASPNEIARILAGMKPESRETGEISSSAAWKSHAASMEGQWGKFDQGRLKYVRQWAAAELGRIDERAPVFYPFSGPDFTYVFNFFPHASAYVLCALEPVGELPDLTKTRDLGVSLQGLSSSMKTLTSTGYFITKNMRVDLRANAFKGTVPILYVMLARSGCTITDAKLISNGVEITFLAPHGSSARKLYYFSTDISNGGLAGNRRFIDFLRNVGARNSYVKAASYLLHNEGFSSIRNTMLSLGGAILQDDSGIPYRYFDSSHWQLRLYGNYVEPLGLFKASYQGDLAQAYQRDSSGKALAFGAGYHWNPKEANLLLAIPK